jgi:hypothetical protein
MEVSLNDIIVGKTIMKRLDDGDWYAAKVTLIEYDPLSKATIYTLVFVDDAEMEKLGIVSLKRLLQKFFPDHATHPGATCCKG